MVTLDLRKDAVDIRRLLQKAIRSYSAKNNAAATAKAYPEVTRVHVSFGGNESTAWVHIDFDSGRRRKPHKATHAEFAKLTRESWVPALRAICNGENVKVVLLNGETRGCDGAELTERIGTSLLVMLIQNQTDGVFDDLPTYLNGLQLTVDGDFGAAARSAKRQKNGATRNAALPRNPDEFELLSNYKKMANASVFLESLGTPVTGMELTQSYYKRPVKLLSYHLSDLSLPSGQIIATDGFIMNRKPFTRRVTPGLYPLMFAVAQMRREQLIAFAMLRFSQAPVTTWELAVTPGENPRKLGPGEIYGYPVDTGTGCFMDRGAEKLLKGSWATVPDLHARISAEMHKVSKRTRGWAAAVIETTAGSAALFESGWGDGVYASYFGLDAAGNVGALVTDFAVVDWPRRP